MDGSPYDNGYKHGQALTEEIRHSIVDYRLNVEKTFGREHAPRIIEWALEEADFRASVKDLVPDAWEELRGIADGAGVSVDEVFLLQLFEEVYEAAPVRIGLDLGEVFGGHGCTAFAADGTGVRIAGQNMDYSGNLQKKQMVAHFAAPGVNSRGVSVFVTTLPPRPQAGSGWPWVDLHRLPTAATGIRRRRHRRARAAAAIHHPQLHHRRLRPLRDRGSLAK